jgi:hypothetical protein
MTESDAEFGRAGWYGDQCYRLLKSLRWVLRRVLR